MSNTAKNTHRRPMRTVTPVVRAGRAAAGAAVAAGMLFGGAAAATADGESDAVTADVQADAAAAPAVIVPAAVEPVNIPAVDAAAETEATGLVALEAPALTVTVPEPEPEVVEAPEEDAEQAEDSSEEQSSEDGADESEESSSDSGESSRDSDSSDSEESDSDESSSRSDSEESSDSEDESSSTSEEKEKSSPAPSAAKGSSILATARSGIGVPYVWGGDDPSGWDCSGFVQWVYGQHGISLPHSAGSQVAQGTRISRSEARPGDLVYKPGHIGIYAGDGRFVDAGNPRVDTTERDIYSGDWSYYRIG
ncbi:hydrolase [Brachybacterium phenoliresistens]|uniref:Hydrolase n=1 Tax=Brachybacterium phenoliresistens TaxID=396014 RepID=Z9JU96_9MICO|nr:C40 family peptidase [Brachybacterium phenoliresistens]EWS81940.1 hydrolase [Brachybacterium phenoliresistens]